MYSLDYTYKIKWTTLLVCGEKGHPLIMVKGSPPPGIGKELPHLSW